MFPLTIILVAIFAPRALLVAILFVAVYVIGSMALKAIEIALRQPAVIRRDNVVPFRRRRI
jgi:hypothetical protein